MNPAQAVVVTPRIASTITDRLLTDRARAYVAASNRAGLTHLIEQVITQHGVPAVITANPTPIGA